MVETTLRSAMIHDWSEFKSRELRHSRPNSKSKQTAFRPKSEINKRHLIMDDESFGAGDVVPDSEGEEDRLLTPPPKLAMLEPERRKSDNFFSCRSSC
jgi:hypothetical protein